MWDENGVRIVARSRHGPVHENARIKIQTTRRKQKGLAAASPWWFRQVKN